MDDLIFRSAAIEAIYEAFPECRNLGMAASALEDVPPAQQWIPVVERLPEKGQIVVAVGEKGTWDVGMFTGLAFRNLDPSKWYWKKNTTKTVKWWMLKKDALPEPPKEEP